MSDKVAEIPQDVELPIKVKEKIEATYKDMYVYGKQLSVNAAEYGYSLAQQEIERLKGLIEKAFEVDYYPDGDIKAAWEQFKTENKC